MWLAIPSSYGAFINYPLLVFTDAPSVRLNKGNKLAAEAYLKKLADRFKYENVDIRCEMLTGHPAEMMADSATKNQPDLIIIATHGRSGPGRWVWESAADRLLRAAWGPILMVRAPGCFPGI